jgi:hypothetical protein
VDLVSTRAAFALRRPQIVKERDERAASAAERSPMVAVREENPPQRAISLAVAVDHAL